MLCVVIKIVRQYFGIVLDKDEVTGQRFLLLEHFFFLRRRTLRIQTFHQNFTSKKIPNHKKKGQ